MPEEFLRINKRVCPHRWPKMADFFNVEHKTAYHNWREFDTIPEDQSLVDNFESYRKACQEATRAIDEWEMLELARCHGRWIALVERWAEFYAHDCEPSERTIPTTKQLFCHAFPSVIK